MNTIIIDAPEGSKEFLQSILSFAVNGQPIALISDCEHDLDLSSKLSIDIELSQHLTGNVFRSNVFKKYPETTDKFIGWLSKIRLPAHVIRMENDNRYASLNEASLLTVPDNEHTGWWSDNREECFRQLQERFTGLQGELVIVSAGLLTSAIIAYLWRINPNNAYLDMS